MNEDLMNEKNNDFMLEIIPSKWMREYFKKVNRKLNDKEKATMIWNIPNITWNDRLNALKKLEDKTTNVILQKEIGERIALEKEAFNKFKYNENKKYVYVVKDAKERSYGYLSDYETAYKVLLNSISEYPKLKSNYFTITKQFICSASDLEENIYNSKHDDGCVEFDIEGNITYLYSRVKNKLEENFRNRFEGAFFRIPCGLRYCCVKILEDNSYGVVDTTEEKWEEYMDRCFNLDVDYSDIQVVVYSLTENGRWSHHHVNPLFLEPQMPEQIEGDEKRNALIEATKALVQYFEEDTEINAVSVLKTAKNYVRECQKQAVCEIKNIDDIFC